MEVDGTTPGAAQRGVACDPTLLHVMAPLLAQCNARFTTWYEAQHGAGSVPHLKRLQSFVTRYRPLPNENALLRHIDGAHVDGSVVLALPTDAPFVGGGVTVWEPRPPRRPVGVLPRAEPSRRGASDECAEDNVADEDGATLPPGCASVVAAHATSSAGGGGSAELAYHYPLPPGSLCLLDNYVWHQVQVRSSRSLLCLLSFYLSAFSLSLSSSPWV
jgi:hypothetical protein